MKNESQDLDFSTILASAVHDMKNSVGMLLGGLDEITGKCGDVCPSIASINQLRYEGKRLNRNLVQVLTLYRVNGEHYSLNLSENDVGETLEECFLENEPLLSMKGVELKLACEDELVYFYDRELVSGVINSAINNAYKYARDRIVIGATEKDGYLVLYVEDNGAGYPEHMLECDVESDHEVSFEHGSTGLGMLFAETIARMHKHKEKQGYVAISNDGIDGGARFSLCLP
jgi:K+-sensing histidine kinase KdpD